MSDTRYTALILSACIVAVYLVQHLVSPLMSFAFVADNVLQEPWTIVTAMFLHSPGDFMHLLNNLFFLALFGFMLEQVIGTRKFLALYLTGGIAAHLAAFTFYPSTPVLGASGAISAVVAALAVVRPRAPGLLWGVPAPMWAVLLGWIGFNALGTGSPGDIAFAAHLYGLVYGGLAGLFLRREHARPADESDPDLDLETWEDEYMRN